MDNGCDAILKAGYLHNHRPVTGGGTDIDERCELDERRNGPGVEITAPDVFLQRTVREQECLGIRMHLAAERGDFPFYVNDELDHGFERVPPKLFKVRRREGRDGYDDRG